MTPGPFICEKLPEYQPFRDLFWRDVWHLAPLRGKSQPYIDELQILSCLCMPSHVIACLTACTSQHQKEYQTFALLVFCEENPLVTGGFPSQRANGAEKVSISWRISWTRDHEVSQKTRWGMLAQWLGSSHTCKVMGGHPQGTILKIARKKVREILKNIKSDLQLNQVYCSRSTTYFISLT